MFRCKIVVHLPKYFNGFSLELFSVSDGLIHFSASLLPSPSNQETKFTREFFNGNPANIFTFYHHKCLYLDVASTLMLF